VDSSTFGDRLKALRKAKKMNQTQLAKVIGCSQPTVHDYEKGGVSPSIEGLQKIANEYKVNMNWLLTGEGDMYLSANIPVSDNFKELTQMLETMIDNKFATYFKNGVAFPDDASPHWHMRIQGEIACGNPMPFVEDVSDHMISVPKRLLTSPEHCYVFRVNGDSMAPYIEHSDLVVIRIETDWRTCNDKIVAVKTPEGNTLKKLHYDEKKKVAYLLPLNPKYQQIMLDADCTLNGYLLLLIRYH